MLVRRDSSLSLSPLYLELWVHKPSPPFLSLRVWCYRTSVAVFDLCMCGYRRNVVVDDGIVSISDERKGYTDEPIATIGMRGWSTTYF